MIITYMALRRTGQIHDDVIKWKHFPLYWPFVWGIHQSPVKSPHKGQWRGTLMFSLICAWTNGWVNNRNAGDLRRYRDHYDVTVKTCGSLERTTIVTSKSTAEWNIFMVRVGLGWYTRTDPRPAVRPAEGRNSFHWKNVQLEVLSCCTKFHEPRVVLE